MEGEKNMKPVCGKSKPSLEIGPKSSGCYALVIRIQAGTPKETGFGARLRDFFRRLAKLLAMLRQAYFSLLPPVGRGCLIQALRS
ncbi:MAG: hypothetical protein CSA62_02745 [Planctomycetota bacterium]|nr:MAG: hypothetical protein CSA62_02745 [Planctomycetota bacterium]